MAQGIVTGEQHEGNHHADQAVEHARSVQRSAHRHVMAMFYRRWKYAKDFTRDVQDMMLAIVQEARRRRRQTLVDTAQNSYTHRKVVRYPVCRGARKPIVCGDLPRHGWVVDARHGRPA